MHEGHVGVVLDGRPVDDQTRRNGPGGGDERARLQFRTSEGNQLEAQRSCSRNRHTRQSSSAPVGSSVQRKPWYAASIWAPPLGLGGDLGQILSVSAVKHCSGRDREWYFTYGHSAEPSAGGVVGIIGFGVPQHPTQAVLLGDLDLGSNLVWRVTEILEPGTNHRSSPRRSIPSWMALVTIGPGWSLRVSIHTSPTCSGTGTPSAKRHRPPASPAPSFGRSLRHRRQRW